MTDDNWMIGLLTALGLALATGCSPLPKYAGQMETVKVTPENSALSPQVNLESGSRGSGVVAMASDATGIAAAVNVKKKFERNFSDSELRRLTGDAVVRALNEKAATPFEASETSRDGEMEVAVAQYGIEQEGATPLFFVTFQTKIFYTKDGGAKRIWRNTYRCAPGSGFWSRVATSSRTSASWPP